MREEDEAALRHLLESVKSNPDDAALHFELGVLLWEKGEETREKAAEHFVISAKLNPQSGDAFRYLGHFYRVVSVESQRALKCYQRAVTLNPNDSDAGEAICDLLDGEGKGSLEIAVCKEASEKSARAFWAFCRMGYLQLHQKKLPEAIQSLQHAIRGYPSCADLWEALGLAYQQMGMFTAAIKSYGRAIELDESRVFSLVESGNICLVLGSFRKGVEQFRRALQISPENVSAHYGLASAILSLAKESLSSGAFRWGASLLEEASEVAMASTSLVGNLSCLWKLYGDIQLTYAKCFPWLEEDRVTVVDVKVFSSSILSWRKTCLKAAVAATGCYQRALHLSPWEANLYTDTAIASDLCLLLKTNLEESVNDGSLPEKMCLGSLLLECTNNDFWVALGCLSDNIALKQHALIRSLQLDASVAVSWAYLGKLYREKGETQLAQQAFDLARSIDPSLALPWAGMAADADARKLKSDEAYECCLRAAQILPVAEFQIGVAKLALQSGHLSSSDVFGAVKQSLQRSPHFPESHNLNGLVYEARGDYDSAVASYKIARFAMIFVGKLSKSYSNDVSFNLARSLCKAGNFGDAVEELDALKAEGPLDSDGMQIYALCLWRLGKGDLALSVARTLAASVFPMQNSLAAASICFICRLLYQISGHDAAITSILKMPKQLFQSSKISFVVSAIHSLDKSDQLESVVSMSHSSLESDEEISKMHFLIALGNLVKHETTGSLGLKMGIDHLRKALHMYPNSAVIRNLLSYLLLSSQEWKDSHTAMRCFIIDDVNNQKDEGLKSTFEMVGAGAVACCYSTVNFCEKFLFPTCRDSWMIGSGATRLLQRYLHQQPWNHDARYLLVLNYLQKARNERYPPHLCMALERLIVVALSNPLYLDEKMSCQYQVFQLLLCAAEISLQRGDKIDCIRHARSASELSLPDNHLFFAHLLLCRAYAVQNNFISLEKEYMKCLNLKTDSHVGWIYLKFLSSLYKLQTDSNSLALRFEECFKEIKHSWNIWMGIFNFVEGLLALWTGDYLSAEEFLAQACSLASKESCFFLCHGVICMELAKQQCDSKFLRLAVRSLKKAKQISVAPLPIASLILAQAEGSLGSRSNWEKNLATEWSSWPPEMRPAELFFQMYLLRSRPPDVSTSSYNLISRQNPVRWILQSIHLNPSCSRYWRVLQTFL